MSHDQAGGEAGLPQEELENNPVTAEPSRGDDVTKPLLDGSDADRLDCDAASVQPVITSCLASREFALAVACFVEMTDSFLHAAPIPILDDLLSEYNISRWHLGPLHGAYGLGHLVGCICGFFMIAQVGLKTSLLFGGGGLVLATVLPLCGLLIADANTFLASLYLNRFLGGVASSANSMSAFLLIVIHYDKDRGKAMGICSACSSAGGLMGLGAGGLLYEYAETWEVFAVTLCFVFVDLILRQLFHDSPLYHDQSPLDTDDTFQLSRFKVPMNTAIFAFFVQQTVSQTLWPVLPSYYKDQFDDSSSEISLALILATVTCLCSSPISGAIYDMISHMPSKFMMWGLCLFLFAATSVGTAYASSVPSLMLMMVAVGTSKGLLWPVTMALIAHMCDMAGVQKTIYAAWSYTLFGLALLLGPLIGVGLYMHSFLALQWTNAGALLIAVGLVAYTSTRVMGMDIYNPVSKHDKGNDQHISHADMNDQQA